MNEIDISSLNKNRTYSVLNIWAKKPGELVYVGSYWRLLSDLPVFRNTPLVYHGTPFKYCYSIYDCYAIENLKCNWIREDGLLLLDNVYYTKI